MPSSSRNTQSKGIAGTTSTWCLMPFTVSSIMSMLPFVAVVVLSSRADVLRASNASEFGQKQTLGNDRLLRCRSRLFDQCCHLARVRKKDCVAARKLDDLRSGTLRHES